MSIPRDLVAGLTPGIASPGVAFHTFRPFQVGFLIEFAEQFKEQDPGARQSLIDDPWAFKDFLTAMRCRSELLRNNQNTPRIQRQALLHLVHPDTFEGTVSVNQKEQFAEREGFCTLSLLSRQRMLTGRYSRFAEVWRQNSEETLTSTTLILACGWKARTCGMNLSGRPRRMSTPGIWKNRKLTTSV